MKSKIFPLVYTSTKAFPIWTNMGSSGSRRYVALNLEQINRYFNYIQTFSQVGLLNSHLFQ